MTPITHIVSTFEDKPFELEYITYSKDSTYKPILIGVISNDFEWLSEKPLIYDSWASFRPTLYTVQHFAFILDQNYLIAIHVLLVNYKKY